MISKRTYQLLFVLLGLVYLAGLFVTLFENDSAQFAVMAMRMVQENDFTNLFKGPEEYLDKPHLHYWLAALSYLIFGIHDWAYRIPALLATALGAYSCFGLGKTLYSGAVGRLAALIFLSSQTIVLAGIDVRTDAVLTGCTAFAIWQFASYAERRQLANLIWGSLGAGLAFSTKGQIAILVIALPLVCHLAYTRNWKHIIDWRLLIGLGVFALAISPVLYAYYQQFDMHPEKVIRGRSDRSGIFFIIWEQSFERLSGEGVGKNSSDYFFFFHTFLWVFLPWTFAGIAACWQRAAGFFRSRGKMDQHLEILTIGGITLIFIVISFAQFKLPHYLNITIPLFAVLTAAYIQRLHTDKNSSAATWLVRLQYGVLVLVFITCGLLCAVVFRITALPLIITALALAAIAVFFLIRRMGKAAKIIICAASASILLNAVLNLHFYPSLLEYQGGSAMAAIVEKEEVPVEKIYKISERHSWAFDFYNKEPLRITHLSDLASMEDAWVYATEAELNAVRDNNLVWDKQFTVDQFRITRLQARFLDPSKRPDVLGKMYLIHLP